MNTHQLLKAAVDARVPLVVVESDDSGPYLLEVLRDHVQRVAEYASSSLDLITHGVNVLRRDRCRDLTSEAWREIEEKARALGATVIAVSPEVPPHGSLVIGPVDTTPERVKRVLRKYQTPRAQIAPCVQALAGLPLRESTEIVRMAQALHGVVSAEGVRAIRQALPAPLQGVQRVSTDGPIFTSPDLLEYWRDTARWFHPDVDPELQPRGVILTGASGTGKTMGVKWLAQQLELPLYRLDMGLTRSKWVGESEANLDRALRFVEREAPCVLLIDEAEKLFHSRTSDGSDGASHTLFANLLWWLEERRKPVFVGMTTNDCAEIPSELFRAGRLDTVVEMGAWERDSEEATAFVGWYLSRWISRKRDLTEMTQSVLAAIRSEHPTPAELAQEARSQVRRVQLTGMRVTKQRQRRTRRKRRDEA